MKLTNILNVFIFLVCSYACSQPTEINVDIALYERVQTQLKDSINKYIIEKKGPYHSHKFADNNMVIIDSLILSPDEKKIVAFVITQNMNSDTALSIEKDSLFDASCFIGILHNKNILNLKWFPVFNIRRFTSIKETSDEVRHQYFKDLEKIKDSNNKSLYKYNVGDKRFWNSFIWDKYFNEKNE